MGRRRKKEAAAIPETEALPDIDSVDWGEEKLTKKEKLFCFWYAHPDTHGNASLAARKAGYSDRRTGYALLQKGKIRKAVALLEGTIRKESIADSYNRVMQRHINRATLDRTSLFNFETAVSDKGQEYLKITPKRPEELTDAQKDLIEGVEYSGVYGIANYRLYPADKAEREIIRLHERLQGGDKGGAGFDAETVIDVISVKEGLQVKARLMQRNSEIAALANLRDSTDARAEED